MNAYFGAGWWIRHYTDRELVLVKEDYLYRKLTGADGYCKIANQPGLPREELFKQAEERTLETDKRLMELVSREIMPNMTRYHMRANPINRAFETPESSRLIGRKRV